MTIDEQLLRLIDRTASASFDGVEPVQKALDHALDAHRAGDERAYRAALASAGRAVSDVWPHTSALGVDILGFVQGSRRH